MATSPPKEPEVEQTQSGGEDDGAMNIENEGAQGQGLGEFEVKEQDRWLPIANVARIMKTALPENAKIAKEAKECMQECVSEFISFITSEASEKCQQEKRKTVNGEDILFAMTSLGFENYSEALKIYLSKYRETQSSRSENQARPTSSGGYTAGGPVGGSNAANNAGQSFAGGDGESNNIMSPSQGLTADQDASAYGYGGGVAGTGHNGINAGY